MAKLYFNARGSSGYLPAPEPVELDINDDQAIKDAAKARAQELVDSGREASDWYGWSIEVTYDDENGTRRPLANRGSQARSRFGLRDLLREEPAAPDTGDKKPEPPKAKASQVGPDDGGNEKRAQAAPTPAQRREAETAKAPEAPKPAAPKAGE